MACACGAKWPAAPRWISPRRTLLPHGITKDRPSGTRSSPATNIVAPAPCAPASRRSVRGWKRPASPVSVCRCSRAMTASLRSWHVSVRWPASRCCRTIPTCCSSCRKESRWPPMSALEKARMACASSRGAPPRCSPDLACYRKICRRSRRSVVRRATTFPG